MANEYLKLMQKHLLTPNFWCSEEYFDKALLSTYKEGPYCWVEDDAGVVLFPPIHEDKGINTDRKPVLQIWADFPEYVPEEGMIAENLDHELIYNPDDFLSMIGGRWQVFRKNCRKFPKRVGQPVFYEHCPPAHEDELVELLRLWLEAQGEDEVIHDPETIFSYIQQGEHRKIAVGKDGTLYGVNIWDENYRFINYRFCFCVNLPFLSEYMRLLFYTDPAILKKRKLVNDGGVLDNPNLLSFKEKLNPVYRRIVRSYTTGGEAKNVM